MELAEGPPLVRWASVGVVEHEFQHLLDHYQHLHLLSTHSIPYFRTARRLDQPHACRALLPLLAAPKSSAGSSLTGLALQAYLQPELHLSQSHQAEVVMPAVVAKARYFAHPPCLPPYWLLWPRGLEQKHLEPVQDWFLSDRPLTE